MARDGIIRLLRRLAAVRFAEGTIWLAGAFAIYLATAVVLVLNQHLIVGDALSRVGSANYMLFSRDPHLGAIGFVWGPLPTFLYLPLVPFAAIWPPLVQDGFAASIVSALAMAGAVRQLTLVLTDWHLGRRLRWALTGAFALHPLILQYGANGDSEALFLFLLMIVVRQVALWTQGGRVTSLLFAGLALGVAYLTRYETMAVALAVAGLVVAVTFFRATGGMRSRLATAVADALVITIPFAFAFGSWAMANWIIMGNPFQYFSSVYGNAAQLAASAPQVQGTSSGLAISVGQILGLEPVAWLAVAFAGVALIRRADLRVMAVAAVFGSVLTFTVVGWLTGQTFGWLRTTITAIPLTILLFGVWLAPAGSERERRPNLGLPARSGLRARLGRSGDRGKGVLPVVSGAGWGASARGRLRNARAGMVVVLLLLAIPSTLTVMVNPVVGREDHYWGYEVPRYEIARDVAAYVDGMRLPDGVVLIDTFLGFPIVLDSVHPRQFVITSDRDFERVVADPPTFSVRYILVPEGSGLGGLDAIERSWPSMYENGSGIGRLVREFGIDGSGFRWRLYELTAG